MRFAVIGMVDACLLVTGGKRFLAVLLVVLGSAAALTPPRPLLAADPAADPAAHAAAGPSASVNHCGVLAAGETWSAAVIHAVTCTVTVPTGVTLTIEPGAVVKFSTAASLVIKGKLSANGAPGNPILFTSAVDGSSDGGTIPTAQAIAAPQQWGQIRFTTGSDDSSSLTYAVIRYSGSDGNNTLAAITLENASPTLAYLSFYDNFRNAVEIAGGPWQTDTWDNMTVVYLVTGKVTVPAANTLTLPPGIKVKFGAAAGIVVDGKLSAAGSRSNPITLTSHADDSVCGLGAAGEPVCDADNDGPVGGAPQDWGQIRFNPGSDDTSVVQYAVIRYSGFDGEGVVGPIGLVDAAPVLANLTLTGNRRNGVEISPEPWHTTTWNNTSVVYYVNGLATIPKDSTLTVAPGMKIKFAPLIGGLNVEGKLLAAGAVDRRVIFTSIRDDAVCGVGAADEPVCDTDGDGKTEGATSDWKQIRFAAGSDAGSAIRYAIIRYAGRGNSGKLAGAAAIRIDGGAPTVERTLLTENFRGIDALGGATPSLVCNDIYYTDKGYDSPDYSIYVEQVQTPVDARNQWWGKDYGPYSATSNAGGFLGSKVSDGVLFSPWSLETCLKPPPSPPSNLAVQAAGAYTLTVAWADAADASSIDLDRSADGGNWASLARLAPNQAPFVDSGLACATTYYYRARAFRESDYQFSDYTQAVAAKTGECPKPADAVKLYLPLLSTGEKGAADTQPGGG